MFDETIFFGKTPGSVRSEEQRTEVSRFETRVLYVWGWWVWYYRFIALVVYALGVLVVALYFAAREVVLHPSFDAILLLLFLALVVGIWLLGAWMTWREGQSRVTRMSLLPESETLVVRTLNFGCRRIPLTALTNFRYENLRPDINEYQVPILTVRVRGDLPLKIDLDGHILDEPTFKTIFRYRLNRPPAPQRRKRKKKR